MFRVRWLELQKWEILSSSFMTVWYLNYRSKLEPCRTSEVASYEMNLAPLKVTYWILPVKYYSKNNIVQFLAIFVTTEQIISETWSSVVMFADRIILNRKPTPRWLSFSDHIIIWLNGFHDYSTTNSSPLLCISHIPITSHFIFDNSSSN